MRALLGAILAYTGLVCAVAKTIVSPAVAEAARPSCGAATLASGEVARVVDGKTFVLSDGREVRLAAIEAPPANPTDPDEEHIAAGAAAKAALQAIVLNKTVVLRAAGTGSDRYGRLVAEAFTGSNAENWVQYEILTKGYGMVAPGGDIATCVTFLRSIERGARAEMRGLWGDPYYMMKEAQYPDDILTSLGRFAVVSGKVISVRESGGLMYLNFGRRWTEDFTVSIAKRNQRAFGAAGLDPKSLGGRRIEVRGFVEQHGGPAIEASRPDQIEIVEQK